MYWSSAGNSREPSGSVRTRLLFFKAMISDKERLEYGEDRYNRGREEQMIDNVKDLLKAGFEVKRIADALGLPLETVESLREA